MSNPASPARKTALVTGASGGIGQYLAEQLAKSGHNLVITARRTAELEAHAARWRQQFGIEVMVIGSDLAKVGAAAELADAVKAAGITLDVLVNNAGFGGFGVFADSKLDFEIDMMRLNMESLTVLSKRFLPDLMTRRGKLMNVASMAAFQPGPYMAVYYATKAYVLSFSEAIAEELADTGVTVTAFCPGATASGFQDAAALNDSALVKGKKLPSSEEVAIAGYQAMMRGQRVYIPGLMNWLMVQSVRLTPRRLVVWIVQWMTRPL